MSRFYNLNRREKIKYRIKKKVIGSPDRPRLVVYKSLKHMYAQLVDDLNCKTITGVSTLTKNIQKELNKNLTKTEKSKIIGKYIAQKALDINIKKVVFDRNGYLFHGRVKALAEGAREGGLNF